MSIRASRPRIAEPGVELKATVNLAFQEFFERRRYLPGME